MKQDNLLLGRAGELRVASELLLRGHKPSISLVDTGVDLILEDGTKIQVKCANLSKHGSYRFNFRRWDHRGTNTYEDVDFLILWGADSTDFWIYPMEVVRGSKQICIKTPDKRTYTDRNFGKLNSPKYHNNWDIIKKG